MSCSVGRQWRIVNTAEPRKEDRRILIYVVCDLKMIEVGAFAAEKCCGGFKIGWTSRGYSYCSTAEASPAFDDFMDSALESMDASDLKFEKQTATKAVMYALLQVVIEYQIRIFPSRDLCRMKCL